MIVKLNQLEAPKVSTCQVHEARDIGPFGVFGISSSLLTSSYAMLNLFLRVSLLLERP